MERKFEGSAREQYVKMVTRIMYDLQKLRIAIGNRVEAFNAAHGEEFKEVSASLETRLYALAKQMEENAERDLGKAVSGLQIVKWLDNVTGIGPRLSGCLVGMLAPIERFPTISRVWSYCGLGVIEVCKECDTLYLKGKDARRFLERQAARRWETYTRSKVYEGLIERGADEAEMRKVYLKKAYEDSEKNLCSCISPDLAHVAAARKHYSGLILPYNTFLKDAAWKVSNQFVRQGKFYRTVYEGYKESYELANPELTAGHIENRARRATVKLFLSHLWQMWRIAEGLPVGKTYLQERLGAEYAALHEFIEPPYADVFDGAEPKAE